MSTLSELAVKYLSTMRQYLVDKKLTTMLGEICEDVDANGKPDAFRILISTVLSVRNKDESTAIATHELFDVAQLNTPEKIAESSLEEIEKHIKRSGMYITKALRLKQICKILLDKYDGKVPTNFEELLELPGVGRKVANCVLVYAYNTPAIPVDTHVHRISNRTGIVKTRKPEETEQELEKIYPKKYWLDVNETFVIFGKTICKPISPLCKECPITKECPKIIIIKEKKKK
jgi:endonuclease-3